MDIDNTLEQLKKKLNEVSVTMFNIYVDYYVTIRRPLTECEIMALNMYKMMIWKAKTMWQLSDGIKILPSQKEIIANPSNMYPILRSMYEMLFLFRCIYASARNDDERELLLKIWKIRGNNNLIQIPKEDRELLAKKKTAKQENKVLIDEVHNLESKLSLSPSIIGSIELCIKSNSPSLKGYKFEYCDNCDAIIAFREISFSDKEMGIELTGDSYCYTRFSAHSHPSFIGVKNFEESYYKREELKITKELLNLTLRFLQLFMRDFCVYKEAYQQVYDNFATTLKNQLS